MNFQLCFPDSLLVGSGFTKNSRNPGTRLVGGSWWKAIKALPLKLKLKFAYKERRSWNSELSGLQLLSTLTQSHSKKVCFLIWLDGCTDNQILLRKSVF